MLTNRFYSAFRVTSVTVQTHALRNCMLLKVHNLFVQWQEYPLFYNESISWDHDSCEKVLPSVFAACKLPGTIMDYRVYS